MVSVWFYFTITLSAVPSVRCDGDGNTEDVCGKGTRGRKRRFCAVRLIGFITFCGLEWGCVLVYCQGRGKEFIAKVYWCLLILCVMRSVEGSSGIRANLHLFVLSRFYRFLSRGWHSLRSLPIFMLYELRIRIYNRRLPAVNPLWDSCCLLAINKF